MTYWLSTTVLRGACTVLLAATAVAQAPITSGVVRQGRLSFDGRATVGDFTGSTTTVTGEMSGGPTLSSVRGWVEAPVTTLVTGNKRRDGDLNKSMESQKYPKIRFELKDVVPGTARGDTTPVSLHGSFVIHGVTRDATIPATVALLPSGVHVRGDTPLNLKDYKIGGLSKLLGTLKMDEHIVVHLDLTFGPPAGTASHS
jgi:polyisoprenoid-binding protein YceI